MNQRPRSGARAQTVRRALPLLLGLAAAGACGQAPASEDDAFAERYDKALETRDQTLAYDEALRLLDECESLARRTRAPAENLVYVETARSLTWERMGEFRAADEAFHAALGAGCDEASIPVARLYLNRAQALDRRLDPAGASAAAAHAIRALDALPGEEAAFHRARADLVLNQLAYHRGDVSRAIEHAHSAIDRLEALRPTGKSEKRTMRELARAYNNVGVCLLDLAESAEDEAGRHRLLDEAEAALSTGLSLRERLGRVHELARSESNLARAARLRGDLGRSRELLEESWGHLETVWRKGYFDRVENLVSRAALAEELMRPAEARDLYAQAYDEARAGTARSMMRAAASYGAFLLSRDDLDESDRACAVRLWEQCADIARWARGEFSGPTLDELRLAEAVRFGEPFDALALLHLEAGEFAPACLLADEGRAQGLLGVLEESLGPGAAGLPEAAAAAKDRSDRARDRILMLTRDSEHLLAAEAAAPIGAVRAVEARIAGAAAEERAAYRAYLSALPDGAPGVSAIAVGDLRAALPQGAAALLYVWRPEAVAVLYVPADAGAELRGEMIARGRRAVADLRGLVTSVRGALATRPDGPGDGSARDRAAATALSRALLPQDLWRTLERCRRLVIVPDGPLATLPFETLPLPEEGAADDALLVDAAIEIAYAPSLSVLGTTRRRARPAAGAPLELLAVGVQSFGVTAPELRYTRDEVEAIVSVTRLRGGDGRRLVGDAGTHRRLDGTLRERSWGFLHLATHAQPGPAMAPEKARVLLAPEVPAGEASSLTLEEIIRDWHGLLAGCRLVTLSACETQVGPELSGEGVLALPWGFLQAGAEAVIASEWKVNDAATMLLMRRLYENVLGADASGRPPDTGGADWPGSPLPRAAALKEAKRWLRSLDAAQVRRLLEIDDDVAWSRFVAATRGVGVGRTVGSTARSRRAEDRLFADPYYWGGFILIGDPD